jgi:hypothetical protein
MGAKKSDFEEITERTRSRCQKMANGKWQMANGRKNSKSPPPTFREGPGFNFQSPEADAPLLWRQASGGAASAGHLSGGRSFFLIEIWFNHEKRLAGTGWESFLAGAGFY